MSPTKDFGIRDGERAVDLPGQPDAGLYFIGLQWLSKMNSSFLAGIGDDAARLADHIAARTSRERRPVSLSGTGSGAN